MNADAFDDWRRRLVVLVVVSIGCVAMLLTWPAGGPTTSTSQRSVKPTVEVPPTTTTTVDPKAISAGVATLYSHEDPTPQELASVPAPSRVAGVRHGARHGLRGSR